MKILIVDPWANMGSSLYSYTTGMVSEISKKAEVSVAVPSNFIIPTGDDYKVYNWFFKKSSVMDRNNKFRKVIRGIEYVNTYRKIVKLAKREEYDIIEIEWPLIYKVDVVIFRQLKKLCKRFVLKAHNILPHSTGIKYKNDMRKLYETADYILVHGEGIKKEFLEIFPEFNMKLIIQRHGMFSNHNPIYDIKQIDPVIKEKIDSYERIYLFFGTLHEDKGVDRIASIWLKHFSDSKSLLIIAGRLPASYSSFLALRDQLYATNNVLLIEGLIEDNLLNYLVSACSMVLIPYIRGSMSGVVFTCAEFQKTFLSTKFGSIEEYLENGRTAFLVENSAEDILRGLKYIDKEVENGTLREMGQAHANFFYNNYSWKPIVDEMFKTVYRFEYIDEG